MHTVSFMRHDSIVLSTSLFQEAVPKQVLGIFLRALHVKWCHNHSIIAFSLL